jgi:splicing factor 3B subunit 3
VSLLPLLRLASSDLFSYLYQFQKLGDDDDEPEFSSTSYPDFGMQDASTPLPRAYFKPRPLDNLAVADEMESLNPILDSKIMNLLPNSDTPQIFAACGRGARSSLRTLRHGMEVEESVSSELPGIPNAVWTTKRTEDDPYDSYIILSFVNGTLVLSIGETIEEVQDTGFLSSSPTLAVQQIGADALLQVHPHGIRHVLSDRRVNEWRVPSGKTIVAATTNKRQVVVALSSAELVYFELDLDGQLNEYQDRKAMGSTVLALSIAEVPEGRQRTPYLVSIIASTCIFGHF